MDSPVATGHEARQVLESEFGMDMDGFISLAVECKEIIHDNAEIYQVQLTGSIDCEELLDCGTQPVHGRGHGSRHRLGQPRRVARQEETL